MKPTRLERMPLVEAALREELADLDDPPRSTHSAAGSVHKKGGKPGSPFNACGQGGAKPWRIESQAPFSSTAALTERQRALPTGFDATYLDLECLADVVIEPMEPVWGSVVTRGALTVLAGEPGIGKSFVALDIAAAVTRGDPPRPFCADTTRGIGQASHDSPSEAEQRANDAHFLNASCAADESHPRRPRRVLLCSPHYERASALIPRLIAAKADLNLVQTINGVREVEDIDRDGSCWSFQLDRDLPILESELMLLQGGDSEIGVVVIDPFPDGDFSGTRQSKKLHDITSQLAEIASSFQIAVLLVCDALPIDDSKRATSITAYPYFERIAQSVWVVERDPDSDKGRLLLPAKSNLIEDPLALAFSLQNKTVRWQSESVSMTAREYRLAVLQRRRNPLLFEDTSELARATDWLKARLANGAVASWLIKREAAENEISYATLRRAFCGLRCESNQIEGTRHHAWAIAGPPQAVCARRMTGSESDDFSRVVDAGEGNQAVDDGLPLKVPGYAGAGAAQDDTWNVPATIGVHDEHGLEHQLERVLQP